MLCHAVPRHAMPCYAMPCHAMLYYAVVRHAVLWYAAGERRQALEAFVAAFGVEASSIPATSNSRADPVLQVSHALTATTYCC